MDYMKLFKKVKREKSNNAISPIIATLLLILIAIAAGVVVYAYVVGYVGGATSGTPSNGSTMSIDSASASASSGYIVLYVRNVGSNTITFLNAQAYVTTNGQSTPYAVNATTSGTCSSSFPASGTAAVCQTVSTGVPSGAMETSEAAGSVYPLFINVGASNVKSGTTYTVQLTLADGSSVTASTKAA